MRVSLKRETMPAGRGVRGRERRGRPARPGGGAEAAAESVEGKGQGLMKNTLVKALHSCRSGSWSLARQVGQRAGQGRARARPHRRHCRRRWWLRGGGRDAGPSWPQTRLLRHPTHPGPRQGLPASRNRSLQPTRLLAHSWASSALSSQHDLGVSSAQQHCSHCRKHGALQPKQSSRRPANL